MGLTIYMITYNVPMTFEVSQMKILTVKSPL